MQIADFNHTLENEFIKLHNVKLDDYNYKKLDGESIDHLKQHALDNEYCVGFSSDGMMKFHVPLDKVVKCDGKDLYIHIQRFVYFQNRNSRTNIPKKIHFIWFSKGKDLRLFNYIAMKSAMDHNPTYQIYLHCDEEPKNNIYYDKLKDKITLNKIVEPEYINNHFVEWFQNKADYVRLNVLKKFGGIYLDTDYILLKPLDMFLNHRFVMGLERDNNNDFLCNAVIMCEPNNEIIKEWINIYDNSWGEEFIPFWTGHSVMIPAQLRHKYNYLMTIYDNITFYPFLWDDLSILHDEDNCEDYDGSYGIHLWDTEASKTNLLPNDISYFMTKDNAFTRLFSTHVEELMKDYENMIKAHIVDDGEFVIYKGMDSPGHDVKYYGGKTVDELKQLCINKAECVGFNTLGFMKHTIDTNKLIKFSDIGYNNCKNTDNLYIYKQRFNV